VAYRLGAAALVVPAISMLLWGCGGADGQEQESSQAADTAAALDPAYFDPGLPADTPFPRANPDPSKVDIAALRGLLAQAAEQKSDAVVIAQDDVIITEKYFGNGPKLATVMSITKSVVSLAVGALVDDGKIAGVDVPLSTWFPEWNTPPKSQVTLREALTMTSGYQDADDFWNHSDLLGYTRAAPLTFAPGSTYSYSNENAMLFAGIIAQAAGTPADKFVAQRFFAPMGIQDAVWDPDGAGNPQTPGGLYMTPRDLLRIGTLARHGGEFFGKRLVSSSWMTTSTANQTPLEPCYGYLWWIVREGCDGEHFGTSSLSNPVEGFFADGWGGNYVAVIPSSHIVAVRTKDATANPDAAESTLYMAFTQNVVKLAPTQAPR
jgi:CubicO group peptidase (beta-lactamase class C family)